MRKLKNLFVNLLFPGFILSSLVGMVVGISIFFYKGLSEILVHEGKLLLGVIRNNLWSIPIVLLAFLIIAYLQSLLIKRAPIAKGGGIPTSEGIIRGSISFDAVLTLLSTIVLSYVSFFIGLPLGSEGPSVAIGTSIGNISSRCLPKQDSCYKRYIMTSGAATAFSVATGSPISGIIFALEEIHRKFSPMILLISFSSVLAGSLCAYGLSLIIDFDYLLFEGLTLPKMTIGSYWILILVGIFVGVIAIVFNKLIKTFQTVLDKKLGFVPTWVKIFISFTLTLVIGLFIPAFTGGGHGLIVSLLEERMALYILIILLILKFVMIAWISQSGVTGGMFIPILSIGALIGAVISELFGIEEYRTLIICASMAAFMGASIGCPLSALVFSVEALAGVNNVLPIALCVFFAYIIARIVKIDHVYDIILERKHHSLYARREFKVIEFSMTANENSFAVGKQVRDLLLSVNVIVLSVKRVNRDYAKMDNFGDKIIKANDIIYFRAQSYDIDKTIMETEAFFGPQKKNEVQIIQRVSFDEV